MHWLHRHRLWILAGIAVFWTAFVILLHFTPDLPFFSNIWRGEQNIEDLLRREGRKTPTHSDFVFIGIDQTSMEFKPFDAAQVENSRALQLMAEKTFPWSREVWALFLDRMFAAGTRLVVFDVIFSPPNVGDPPFRAALDRYRDKVVIGANFDFSNVGEVGGAAVNIPPNTSLIPDPPMLDDRVGYVVFFPDWLDKKIRSIRYTITDMQLARRDARPGEIPYEALSARALEKLGHAEDVPRDLQPHVLRFSALEAYQPRPLWEVFDDKIWHANYKDGAFFKDKVIIVGPSAQIIHDVHDTPLGPETPGPALHLNALAAALDHEFLYDVPIKYDFLTICIAGIFSWVLLALIRRPLVCLLAIGAVAVVYLGLARVLYDWRGILIMVVPTMTAFLVSGLFGLGFEYTLEILEKRRTRRTLERYVSKNLVKEILDNPDSYYHSLLGVRVPATMLLLRSRRFHHAFGKSRPRRTGPAIE